MNAADQESKTPKWTDIARDPGFQGADWQTKQRVRGEFYRRAIEPNTPASLRSEVQSQFFTRTEADVFGEREEKDTNAPGLVSNALRNAGERGLDLAGNALQFAGNVADRGEQAITDRLGGINPGVIGGSAEEMRTRGYEPDIELGDYGLDFTLRAKPEDTSTGLVDTGQAIEDVSLGYQPNYTIDRALDEPSLKTLAGAAAEQGPAALADMAGLVINLPAYLAARTQEIGEARVQNDSREGMPEGRDYAVSGPTAVASVLLDRFALGRLLPGGKNAVTSARQIPGAVGRASGTEGLTEAIQEGGIEYAGESVGTEAGWNPVTAGRRAAGGVIVGAPTGGAVRGGTAAMELRSNGQQEGGQPSPIQEDVATPEAETANIEAVGSAAELIAKPRFELSSAEREVRDSISYGDAFKALRSAAEERGDSEAVTELDAVSGEISAALEAETMARTRNDSEAFTPIREQLQGASERFTRIMERLNAPEASAETSPPTTNEEGNAQWEEAWREQAAEDGIADYDPNADLPDTTIDIDGQQPNAIPEQGMQAAEASVPESGTREVAAEPETLAPDQPSETPDRMTTKRVPVANIQVDPDAYQFRTNVNQDGVDSRLEGVEKWDDLRAGNLILHERLDGSLYAADGHHRIDLARQLEQPDVNAIVLREADGITVEDARREAAEANIAAGNATAIDAAKVFRNSEEGVESTIAQRNLPRSQVVRDGVDLAKLADEPFGAVLNQVVAEKDGAAIGRAFEGADQQLAAIDVFQRVKPTNENQRAILANEIRQAGFADGQRDQMGMFGEDPTQSLIGERVRVMDNLRQSLVRDRRLFATLNDNAQAAEQAGNRIARDQNEALQDASAQAVDLLHRATTTPEINQQINDAARRVNEGESLASVTRDLKEALLRGPDTTAAQQPRTPAPSGGQIDQAGQESGRSEQVLGRDNPRTASAGEQRLDDGERGQTERQVTFKVNGAPFQTRRAVELSKRFRETPNAEPVEVEAGWGFAVAEQDAGTIGERSRDQINADLDAVMELVNRRYQEAMRGADPNNNLNVLDFATEAELSRRHSLILELPSQAQERYEARQSIERRAKARREARRARADDAPLLDSYTEGDIAAREQAQQQADQSDSDQRNQEAQRAQADTEVDDFTLAGSNRIADTAAAQGQQDLTDAPQEANQAESKSPQESAITWNRRAKNSRVWKGSNGMIIADTGFSSGGKRLPMFMVFADSNAFDKGQNTSTSYTLKEAKQAAQEASRLSDLPVKEQRYAIGQSTAASQSPRAADITAALKSTPELSDARVIQSTAELPADALMGMMLRGINPADVRGMFVGGELYVVADNVASVQEAVRTAVHESVGHKGMRGVLGAEMEPLMLEVYKSHTRSQAGRDNIAAIQESYPFIDVTNQKGKVTLAEELVAHYIEDSKGSPTLSQRIKSTVRRLLRKLFPNIEWRTNDILMLGEQSRQWLRRQQARHDMGEPRFSMAPQTEVDKNAIDLYHSGQEIKEITNTGPFGSFLFFSSEKGIHGGGTTYRIDVSPNEIIEASRLFYHEDAKKLDPLVNRVQGMLSVDEDTAIELIEQNLDPHELDSVAPEDASELSLEIQVISAEAARSLGFKGVSLPDEHGTSYMIDMLGREGELIRIDKPSGQSDLIAANADIRYSLARAGGNLSARELSTRLLDDFPGLKLDMAGRGQRVTISRIVAPTQGKGTGSEVIRRLTQWADASGKTLALTPSSDFGGNVKRLREFYKRAGFVENKGRNKDYEISETMYRQPDHGVGEQRFSLNAPPGTPGGNFSDSDSTNFAMPDESLTDTAIRKMADKMRPLKILEDAIRRSGREIEEEADAYLAEELFHGKAEYDLRQLREQHVEPLAEGLANAKITQSDLDEYLYARHAPERNATIAERNPNKPDMQDGGSGMSNARAVEIIDKVSRSGKQAEYDRLAKIVYDMTRLRRDAIREGGLEDDTVVDAWEAAWQYYVPLKGNAADEPGRPKTGKGFEVSGRESRTAAGRNSIADSPSSQVIVDANESLIRRRKNEVAQSLLSLVTDHPNPSLWEVFTDKNPDTQRTPVTVTDPDTGKNRIEVQERPVNMAGNDKYFKVKRSGRTYYLKIHDERLMNAMRNVGPENNGLLIRMASTATRAMSAMMTSYNPEFMLTNFTRDVQTALLNLSAEQTRDDGKIKGEAIVRQTARDIGPSMKAAWRGAQNKPGKNDNGREWDTWYREFQEDGAKTGYFDMKDISSQAKEIQSMVRHADGTTLSHMLKARKKTADFVENMNSAVENAVRLSAYTNARRAGVSRKQAASLAKNMTVNFNRRGEVGTALNATYMFANASIQGTMNFARTMVTLKDTPDGKSPMNVWARANMAQKLAFGMATGAFALGMLNRWVSEEDEDGVLFYDKVPDYVKERNIVIMSSLWGGEPDDFVSIPLPYGYNVFSVIGTHAEAVTAGKLDATEAAKNLGLAILGSFSPIGWEHSDSATGLLMKNLTPTLVRSFAQVGFNEDFAGRLIYKDDLPFGTPTPASSRAMPSTPEPYQAIARFLNDVSGGSDYRTGSVDINPDVMQHMVNYYGGGAWGFVEKTSSFAARAVTGEEVERYRIPFAGRFASSTSPYRDQGLFYERRDELGQIANEADALKGRERIDFRRDNIEQIRLFNSAKNIEKQLSDDRKRRNRIQETETLSDEAQKNRIDVIERQMKRRVDDFNRSYNELKEAD